MINTEICLFVKRSEVELENVHRKLHLLLTMVEADAVEDCLDTTHDVVDDVRDAAKGAAARIESLGTTISLKLYDIGKAQKAAAPETAKAEPAPEAETAKLSDEDIVGVAAALNKALAAAEAAKATLVEAAPEKTLKDTLDAWDKSREANTTAYAIATACGNCKSDGAGHYIGPNCACTNASELKGGELNG